MIECVKEYLSNITSELGKNIEDMDMESIERADRKSTRLNSSHITRSRMPSSA